LLERFFVFTIIKAELYWMLLAKSSRGHLRMKKPRDREGFFVRNLNVELAHKIQIPIKRSFSIFV